MYAYPECLYFFKTTFRSVVKILGYIYASEEDSLCIHSATKAAKREGWCSHETLLSRHSFLEKHRKIHLDHLWQGTNRCASPFVNASSRFWFEFDLSSQLTENIHREIHTQHDAITAQKMAITTQQYCPRTRFMLPVAGTTLRVSLILWS